MKKVEIPEFKEVSQEEIDKMSASEMGAYFKAKNDFETATKQNELIDSIESLRKEDAEKNEKAIKDLETKMTSVVKENERLAVSYKSMMETAKVGKDKSMTPIKKIMAENKEKIQAIKSNGGKFEVEVDDIATKATHNPTDIADREQLGQFRPGVSEIPYQRTYMEDTFVRANASTEYVKEVAQDTVVRDANNVAACAANGTNNTKVTFDINDLQMKKIRDYTKVCIDMMEDYDFVESQIRKLINTSLMLKKDEALLLADGAGANINGVDSYASTFSASASGANYAGAVDDAQLIDLLVVAGAQIKAFGSDNFFMPNYIHLNPKDATLMGLLKDVDNNYIKAGTVNASVFRDVNGNLFINGMRVVENPNVPENEAYLYDGRKGTLYTRRGSVIEFAYENGTDFEQELVTVKAYERCNLWVSGNDANAFMHIEDLDAGVTAITAT